MAAKTQQLPHPFDWDDARVMLALSRGRTLRAAAHALGVNASTIGRRLDALEEALGTRLFDRTLDGVLPTAAVEQLLPHAEQLEQAALSLVSAADGLDREPEGVVRISALPGVGDHFVAASVSRLLARHPKLQIELDSSIAYADLTRREADIALRIARPTTGDLVAVKLMSDQVAILGSPRYVEELGTLRDMSHARWLAWGHDLALLPDARWLAERVPESAIALRSSSINALLSAAEHGVGLLLISKAFMRVRPLTPVKLAPALAKAAATLPSLELWLVGHRALRGVPRIAAVWDFIVEEFEREAAQMKRGRKS